MKIFVASTSSHKVAAAREAAQEAYPEEGCIVEGRASASGVNEQPIGNDETLRGALNRLANLRLNVMADQIHYDLLVAMEGGLFSVQSDTGDQWFDCGWVVVQDSIGRRTIAHCSGVEFPQADVAQAREKGFETTTVGSIIAQRVGADGTDPQRYLTDGLVCRLTILRQALVAALGQLRIHVKREERKDA